jgi:predicted RecB family nuclease
MHLKAPPPALVLSASDLSAFIGCRHRTALDLGVALGELEKPSVFSLYAEDLRDRGAEHEQQYVDALKALGLSIVDVLHEEKRVSATADALRRGVDVVVQGEIIADGWFGRPDILRRVESPSELGSWSYEVYDTKLARDTRGSTILQLAVYSELLGRVQGRMPAAFHVVTPDPDKGLHAYRVDDYSAYYRLAKHLLAQCLPNVGNGGAPTHSFPVHQTLADAHYPEPTDQCDYCRWAERCEARRRADDHLSYIAGASRLQRAELVAREVTTLAQAAGMPLPIAFKPTRGSKRTYARLREQARVQLAQREIGRPVWELLDPPSPGPETPVAVSDPERPAAVLPQPRQGLDRLPTPSPCDIFLDLEAARFAREGAREYLFGVWTQGAYRRWWATTDAAERAAFEAVVDMVMAAWEANPGLHVYHFGHYEASAFRRLAGRHATRADALDRLLRAGRFIDLHAVVRQSLRAGVESYSIKQLEQYYGYRREADLRGVARSLHLVELALESEDAAGITPALREAVETYNADDCRSTEALRDWLEGPVRKEALARGDALTRPEPSDGAPNDDTRAVDDEVEALRARLLAGIDGDPSDPTHPQHTRWMLAYLIDWHRREQKAAWWEYYRVRELVGEEALDDPGGRVAEEILYRHDEPRLDLVEAGRPWSFDGDGALYRLVAEAHRIRLAHLFDPVLAVHTSLVEPLPHQITAVYEAMLPRQPLRFLLADDPGAGKPVSHIAQTIATRNGCAGFLNACSTSTRSPPRPSKPCFIRARCGMMSKLHFLKSATSFWASLMTISMIVSSIQSAWARSFRASWSRPSQAAFCAASRSSAARACHRGMMRWYIRAQVTLSMHTNSALPDSQRAAQCSTKSAAMRSRRSSAVTTS